MITVIIIVMITIIITSIIGVERDIKLLQFERATNYVVVVV